MKQFTSMSKEELIEVADMFDISIDKRYSAGTMVAKIIEAGVTVDQYEAATSLSLPKKKEELAEDLFSKPEDDGEVSIVKMETDNQSFSADGHSFSKKRPFVLMPRQEAIAFVERHRYFRIVDPSEAAKFYKGVAN